MSSEAIAAPASLIWASVQRVNFDGWWAMVVSFFLKIVSNLDRSIVSMLAPETKFSLALSDSQIGLAKGAAFAVFYAVFLPLWWAADRFVQRLVIALSAGMYGIATILSVFVGSLQNPTRRCWARHDWFSDGLRAPRRGQDRLLARDFIPHRHSIFGWPAFFHRLVPLSGAVPSAERRANPRDLPVVTK